jgi:hypothetical protein
MGCNISVATAQLAGLKGTTLFVEEPPDRGDHRLDINGCIRSTAIYVPDKHDKKKPLNVILWLHGQHVPDYQKNLLGKDGNKGEGKLREGIDTAGKDVVLIAPFLGHSESDSQPLVLPNPNKKGLEGYLTDLLAVQEVIDELGSGGIDKLVLACHSAGGNMMRKATGMLGSLDSKLKECWGFDCMYYDGQTYACWAAGLPNKYLYFYQGGGSNAGHFWEFWDWAYGTPKNIRSPRMNNVFLAPCTKATPATKDFSASVALETLPDDVVFRPVDAIAQIPEDRRSDYETYRLELDKLLDNPPAWTQRVKATVYSHYVVVQQLFGVRVARLFDSKAALSSSAIGRCSAGKAVSPPPPPRPPHTRKHKQVTGNTSKW